jgi:type II secretory pathway component GspD/PulD (secretin)
MPVFRWLLIGAIVFIPSLVLAADPEVKQKPDPSDQLITKLFDQEVKIEGNVNEIPIGNLLQQLSKKYDITFVVKEDYFKAEGEESADFAKKKPKVEASQLHGLTLHQLLVRVFDSLDVAPAGVTPGVTYLIKGKTVEIVPKYIAQRYVRALPVSGDEGEGETLRDPLVSLIVKQKSLTDVVETLANRYDLNVIIGPQAVDATASLVTARLLNVPADTALEMLAAQCGLRSIRKGNAFLITSKDRAKELLTEEYEKEQRKIELAKPRGVVPDVPFTPKKP